MCKTIHWIRLSRPLEIGNLITYLPTYHPVSLKRGDQGDIPIGFSLPFLPVRVVMRKMYSCRVQNVQNCGSWDYLPLLIPNEARRTAWVGWLVEGASWLGFDSHSGAE